MIEIELWLDFQSSAPQGQELLAVVGVDGEAVVGVGVADTLEIIFEQSTNKNSQTDS